MVSSSVACSCSPRPPVSYAPLIGYDPHGVKRRVAGAALVRIPYFIRTITFRRKDARERCRGKGSRAGNSPWPRSEPWDRIDGCASQGTTIRSDGLETGTQLVLDSSCVPFLLVSALDSSCVPVSAPRPPFLLRDFRSGLQIVDSQRRRWYNSHAGISSRSGC